MLHIASVIVTCVSINIIIIMQKLVFRALIMLLLLLVLLFIRNTTTILLLVVIQVLVDTNHLFATDSDTVSVTE